MKGKVPSKDEMIKEFTERKNKVDAAMEKEKKAKELAAK